MLCDNPFVRGNHAFGCGQCMVCLFNKRRMWTHRIMLEATQHSDNCFITLTYSEKWLPSDGSVAKKHVQDWLKRFRTALQPLKVRYYAVGEYGSRTQRPHYHVAMFGFPPCLRGVTPDHLRGEDKKCCQRCELVKETWGFGGVVLGSLETSSAQYIAQYVTKKMTRTDDPRLNGRWPEFMLCSRRPGIGVTAMQDVASEMMRFNLEQSQADVPVSLRHGKRLMPLGRHLRTKLKLFMGLDEKQSKDAQIKQSRELLDVYEAQKKATGALSLKEALVEESQGKRSAIVARSKIKKVRDNL